MKKKHFVLIITLLIFNNSIVYASSGRLRGDSIVSCNGVTYGKHGDGHWHRAIKDGDRWYPDGDSLGYSSPCNQESSINSNTQSSNSNTNNNTNSNNGNNNSNSGSNNSNDTNNNANQPKTNSTIKSNSTNITPVTQIQKSSDVSLKEILIDNKKIDANNFDKYITNKSKVSLKVTPNDEKTKVTISNNYKKLAIGDNNITIIATAEDSSSKDYILNIYRKSNNVNILVKYDNQLVKFNKNTSETIYTNDDEIKFDITPQDTKTKIDFQNSYKVNNGTNKYTIKATSEDGTTKKYIVNVYKSSTLDSFFSIIIAIEIILLPIFAIILLIKAIKEKNTKKKNTIIFCAFFGGMGIHHFYNKKIAKGIIYLLTFGILGIGWLYDDISLITNKYKY